MGNQPANPRTLTRDAKVGRYLGLARQVAQAVSEEWTQFMLRTLHAEIDIALESEDTYRRVVERWLDVALTEIRDDVSAIDQDVLPPGNLARTHGAWAPFGTRWGHFHIEERPRGEPLLYSFKDTVWQKSRREVMDEVPRVLELEFTAIGEYEQPVASGVTIEVLRSREFEDEHGNEVVRLILFRRAETEHGADNEADRWARLVESFCVDLEATAVFGCVANDTSSPQMGTSLEYNSRLQRGKALASGKLAATPGPRC